jgi:hypothetical protein
LKYLWAVIQLIGIVVVGTVVSGGRDHTASREDL